MKMSDRGPESVSATDVEMVKAHAKEKGNNCKKKKIVYTFLASVLKWLLE